MSSTNNALLFCRPLASPPFFPSIRSLNMMGRGLETHRATSRPAVCFCTLDYSRANHGNWDRASAHNELLDPCFKTGSWETHGFATDAPRMGFVLHGHTTVEKKDAGNVSPTKLTPNKKALLRSVACACFLLGRMGSFPQLRANYDGGSAVSETLFSRYAILQHG